MTYVASKPTAPKLSARDAPRCGRSLFNRVSDGGDDHKARELCRVGAAKSEQRFPRGRAAHFSSSHLTSLGSVGPALSHALLTAAAAVRAGSFNSELKGTSTMRAD